MWYSRGVEGLHDQFFILSSMKLTPKINLTLTLALHEILQLRKEFEYLFNLLGEEQWAGSFEVLECKLIELIQDESEFITLTLEEAKELKTDIQEIDISLRGSMINQLWDLLWNELDGF